MCTFCVELEKQKMTIIEVARAFREIEVSDDHFGELLQKIEENYGTDKVAKELNELSRSKK